jgi:hypothetical protein
MVGLEVDFGTFGSLIWIFSRKSKYLNKLSWLGFEPTSYNFWFHSLTFWAIGAHSEAWQNANLMNVTDERPLILILIIYIPYHHAHKTSWWFFKKSNSSAFFCEWKMKQILNEFLPQSNKSSPTTKNFLFSSFSVLLAWLLYILCFFYRYQEIW